MNYDGPNPYDFFLIRKKEGGQNVSVVCKSI